MRWNAVTRRIGRRVERTCHAEALLVSDDHSCDAVFSGAEVEKTSEHRTEESECKLSRSGLKVLCESSYADILCTTSR